MPSRVARVACVACVRSLRSGDEPQAGEDAAEHHLLAQREDGAIDAPVPEPGAVHGSEVGDVDVGAIGAEGEARVPARERAVGDVEIGGRLAPHDEGLAHGELGELDPLLVHEEQRDARGRRETASQRLDRARFDRVRRLRRRGRG